MWLKNKNFIGNVPISGAFILKSFVESNEWRYDINAISFK